MMSAFLASPSGLAIPAALLDALRKAIADLLPVYAKDAATRVADFAYVRLNAAA